MQSRQRLPWVGFLSFLGCASLAGCATPGSNSVGYSPALAPIESKAEYEIVARQALEMKEVADNQRNILPRGALLPPGTYTPTLDNGQKITVVVEQPVVIVRLKVADAGY